MRRVVLLLSLVVTPLGGLPWAGVLQAQAGASDAFYWAARLPPEAPEPLEKRMLERLVPPQQWVSFNTELREMGASDPGLAAWIAYSEGKLPQALDLYARALQREPNAYGYLEPRARIFFLLGKYDSAVVQMASLVEEMRTRDEKQLVHFYDSKALFEYALGLIYVHQGSLDSARAAFGRALTEDLSFYMAHARLAHLALATGDTAQALSEMRLATELCPDDAALHHQYAQMLLRAGNAGNAATHFHKAVEANPDYAAPYYFLGALWDLQQEPTSALEQYRAFLARASQREPLVARARERVTALESTATR
jgi:tetratricopeptide (TPR) repeat protein